MAYDWILEVTGFHFDRPVVSFLTVGQDSQTGGAGGVAGGVIGALLVLIAVAVVLALVIRRRFATLYCLLYNGNEEIRLPDNNV